MSRSSKTRFGVLGVLGIGFVLGYVVACSNTQPTKPSNAADEKAKQAAGVGSGVPAEPTALPLASPVKALGARDVYYPGTEDLAPNEMRVVACGTGMPNARPKQAAACWLVELGNGDKFLFDIGTGASERISAMQIPYNYLNKVFIGHLHSDHFGDLDALYCGGIVANRVVPLEVWGPNSIEPKYGTKAAMDAMEKMLAWDIDTRMGNTDTRGAFLKVTEFPYDAVNNVIYQKNGVNRHTGSWLKVKFNYFLWFRNTISQCIYDYVSFCLSSRDCHRRVNKGIINTIYSCSSYTEIYYSRSRIYSVYTKCKTCFNTTFQCHIISINGIGMSISGFVRNMPVIEGIAT